MVYTFDLTNKVTIISGGYGHLGKAITESFLHHGSIVYVLGRNEDKFLDTFIPSKQLFFEYCDISNNEDIKNVFLKIFLKHGRINVLINNAYNMKGQSPETMTDEDWSIGIAGTLDNVFKCIREIIPYYKNQSFGKIINVSSMYGIVAPQFEVYDDFPEFLNPPHYGAAKAGIIQLTKYYASYLGNFGINVNAVSPGPFPSFKVQESKGFIELLSKKTCLGKIGLPEDLAGAFVFLASDASNFITGQNIIVDGGWTSK